jgi:DNA-binding NtrC family response regulator
VERLMLLATDGQVNEKTVELVMPQTAAGALPTDSGTLAERVQRFEREAILSELRRSHHHVTNAARILGLERSHLYKKAEQLGIDLQAVRNEPGDNPR